MSLPADKVRSHSDLTLDALYQAWRVLTSFIEDGLEAPSVTLDSLQAARFEIDIQARRAFDHEQWIEMTGHRSPQ